MVVTATEIKIKSVLGFFRFARNLKKIRSQLNDIDGLIFQKYKGLRTLTGWESREAMKAFRNNGSHLDAMKNIRKIGKAKSITWESQSEPEWDDALERLNGVKF